MHFELIFSSVITLEWQLLVFLVKIISIPDKEWNPDEELFWIPKYTSGAPLHT